MSTPKNGEREKSIFQRQLEQEASKNSFLLVVVGCLFFSVAIFGANYMDWQYNARKHIDFLIQTFKDVYESAERYMNAPENQNIFIRCIRDLSGGQEVGYSVNKYNATSPLEIRLILSDAAKNVVFSNFSQEDMNLHRTTYLEVINENVRKSGREVYNAVYYLSGDTSEYVFSRPLYDRGDLAGFASVYLDGSDWGKMFSDYQYDGVITDLNGNIIFCSRDGLLPERSANKFKDEKGSHTVSLGGIQYLVTSRTLPHKGVVIYSFIYLPKNSLYMVIGIITIVCMGILWFFMSVKMSQIMAGKNARSVNLLADEMRIIRHGDYEHVITINTGDEFEEIGCQINKMIKSINELNTRNTDLIRLNGIIEISNLQTQINPHFIYNTLDTIKYLIFSEPQKSAHLIEKFTHILRYSINNTKMDVPLSEDMRYIEDYLYIQKTRFGERFVCKIAIDGECGDCRIPKLLLQPLIENSTKYGFKKRMAVTVAIKGWREEGYLVLTVEDNGPGVPRATLEILRAMMKSEELKTEHNGLQNIARRIQLEYGEDSGLYLDSEEGEFFRVTAKLKCERGEACTV